MLMNVKQGLINVLLLLHVQTPLDPTRVHAMQDTKQIQSWQRLHNYIAQVE